MTLLAMVGVGLVFALVELIRHGHEGDAIRVGVSLALCAVAFSMEFWSPGLQLTERELVVREAVRTRRIPRDRIRSMRGNWRQVALLSDDDLAFAKIARARYTDAQLRELAAELGVPIIGPRYPFWRGRLEE